MESFVELLSPNPAQPRETLVVDSASFYIGVQTNSNTANTDTINQLKAFFADSDPITEVDFAKNEVIIPKDKHGTEGLME